MSYTKDFDDGKDTVVFLTKEDQDTLLENDNAIIEPTEEVDDGPGGAIKPNGEIDWDCPCLKGMAYGPCGQEFRDAFSCFVKSDAEPKGLDCVDAFESMQKCMASHPEHYGVKDDDEEDGDLESQEAASDSNPPPASPTTEDTPSDSGDDEKSL